MNYTRSLLFSLVISSSWLCSFSASEDILEPVGLFSDLPTVFRAGAGFACSIGAAAAFVASSYILAHQYSSHVVSTQQSNHTIKKSSVPVREFWWSVSSGAAFLVTLYLLTATHWSKQT